MLLFVIPVSSDAGYRIPLFQSTAPTHQGEHTYSWDEPYCLVDQCDQFDYFHFIVQANRTGDKNIAWSQEAPHLGRGNIPIRCKMQNTHRWNSVILETGRCELKQLVDIAPKVIDTDLLSLSIRDRDFTSRNIDPDNLSIQRRISLCRSSRSAPNFDNKFLGFQVFLRVAMFFLACIRIFNRAFLD